MATPAEKYDAEVAAAAAASCLPTNDEAYVAKAHENAAKARAFLSANLKNEFDTSTRCATIRYGAEMPSEVVREMNGKGWHYETRKTDYARFHWFCASAHHARLHAEKFDQRS